MPATGESPEFVSHILESLRSKESTYQGGAHVYDSLGSTSLTIIAGPTGAGKSTTSDEVIRISNEEDLDISLVQSTITRPRRGGDPIDFRTASDGVTYAELNDAVINDNLVNYNVIGDNIYATYRSGFPGRYNIGPILTKSVHQLLNAGFRNTNVAYMVTDGDTYEQRLRQERLHFPDITPRIIEGHESLDFAEMNITADWLYMVESLPVPDGLTKAARKVISIARHQTGEIMTPDRGLQYIDEMRQALKRVARDVH